MATADTTGVARGVEVVGNYAYIADDYKGVQVIDVSNPSSPRLVGAQISTDAPALSLRAQGRYLYLAKAGSISGGADGLVVFDISNPVAPKPSHLAAQLPDRIATICDRRSGNVSDGFQDPALQLSVDGIHRLTK